ncbi:MAG: glycosyltransferase [Nitrospirota bacterium]
MKNKSKDEVVFIIPSLYQGGAERVLLEIIKNLDADKFDCNLICFYKNLPVFGSPLLTTEIESYGNIKLHYLNDGEISSKKLSLINRAYNGFLLIFKLSEKIRQFRRDAILVPFLEPTAVILLFTKLLGVKNRIVISLHTNETAHYKSIFSNRFRLWIEMNLLRWACQKADAVIVPSEGVKFDLVNNFSVSVGKILTIASPIDEKKIQKLVTASLNYGISIPRDTTMFCHIGRLEKQKNHLLLIKACSLLRKRYEKFIVLCAGSGSYENEIMNLILEECLENHVKLIGNLSNPYVLMSRSRALILTSQYESFSLVLVEAMASGTVCISVDCPYGPAEVLANGEYGILVPPDNPEALAGAMHEVIHNNELVQILISKGRRRALDYSIEGIVKNWEAVLQGAN